MDDAQLKQVIADTAASAAVAAAAETRRHFDIVAEDMRHDIRLIAEGLGVNNEKIDALTGRMDRVETRLETVDTKVDALRSEMKTGFKEVRTRIDRLESVRS